MTTIKGVVLFDLEKDDLVYFVYDEPGEPPPLIEPKVKPKRRRGRPRKNPKVS